MSEENKEENKEEKNKEVRKEMEDFLKRISSKILPEETVNSINKIIDSILKENNIPSTISHYKAILEGIKISKSFERDAGNKNQKEGAMIASIFAIINKKEKALAEFKIDGVKKK